MLIFVKLASVFDSLLRHFVPRHFLAKSRKRKCNFLFSHLLENGVRGGWYNGDRLDYIGNNNVYWETKIYSVAHAYDLKLKPLLPQGYWNRSNGMSLRCVVR